MARVITPMDCHVLINAIAKEVTGGDATIQAHNTSTFVAVGETILSHSTENVVNALSIVLGRSYMMARPYEAKFKLITANSSDLYSTRMRRISYYQDNALSDGSSNTQLNPENLKAGQENTAHGTLDSGSSCGTGSMFEQHPKKPVQLIFSGVSTWQYCVTIYEDALKMAFTSEAEFASFINGILTEAGADIATEKEAFARMTLLNYIGGLYDLSASMPGSVVNMTSAYNTKFGTSYTSAQLRTTYLNSFLKFFVSEIKKYSNFMTERTSNYHWTPSATDRLLRHTPKADQRLILYGPLITEAKAWVMPEIFNPSFLSLDSYEEVNWWQNPNDGYHVKCTPAIPNTSDPTAQTTGNAVNLDCVLGVLFDKDALMVDYTFDRAVATPLEARKLYRNTWYTFYKNAINDFSMNGILFYMADPTP